MYKEYEAPQLTLIGQADEVVLGMMGLDGDVGFEAAPDFEFEQD
jgi:hypothetical protein